MQPNALIAADRARPAAAPVLGALRPAGLHQRAVGRRHAVRHRRPHALVHHVEQHLREGTLGLTCMGLSAVRGRRLHDCVRLALQVSEQLNDAEQLNGAESCRKECALLFCVKLHYLHGVHSMVRLVASQQ